jgi:hypothetical protein
MKNIHLLPTDQPSRLHESGLFSSLGLSKEYLQWKFGKNIYITSDEEIKEEDWYYDTNDNESLFPIYQRSQDPKFYSGCKKIILTTDQNLIKDGVQAIDDEFLEWFVNNSSCEYVEVRKEKYSERFDNDKSAIGNTNTWGNRWVIIIPKEKPKQKCKDCNDNLTDCTCIEDTIDMKQETLEEAAEKYAISKDSSSIFIKVHKKDFINGAKWQQERSYTEEEVKRIAVDAYVMGRKGVLISAFKYWFEQFKKK